MTPKLFTFARLPEKNSGEIVWCDMCLKARSHRNDYERIQLKTDLRLVKIIKSEGKPFHICLNNMFSDNIVKLFFKIHNFSLS